MARIEQNDTFYAGNRRTIRVTVYDDDNPGQRLNLTGLTAKWVLASLRADGVTFEGAALIQKSTVSGITITNAAQGELEIALAAADTTALAGDYYHELELFDGDGNGLVVMTGILTIRRNVANT